MRALRPELIAKPWGRDVLPPGFPDTGGVRIGEIAYRGSEVPVLVKHIFTSERLSIQVHPDDEQARARGLEAGKTECWLILDAEPGAVLGLGTRVPLDAEALRAAAEGGSLEGLMDWLPVAAGDFFLVPAGTVHAIGAGVSLLEVQQPSDVTYRLWDYGRPRELHLADGVAVAKAGPYPAGLRKRVGDGDLRLAETEWFRLDWVADGTVGRAGDLLVPAGPVLVDGVALGPGACVELAGGEVISGRAAVVGGPG